MNQPSPKEQSTHPQGVVLNSDYRRKKVFFGIFFVFIAFVILIGILSSLNVFPVSGLFPQEQKQVNNATIAPTASPIISMIHVKETLMNYLSTVLIPSQIPHSSDISFTQDEYNNHNFTLSWPTKTDRAIAVFDLSLDNFKINQFDISFASDTKSDSVAPIDLTRKITSQFISLKPKGEWKCSKLKTSSDTYCENFWEEENGNKLGIGLLENIENDLNLQNTLSSGKNSKTFYISFCQRNRESKKYSWKSCNADFTEIGL